MEFYLNVFPNKKKKTESHPDFNVLCTIDDVQHEGGLWVKADKNGNTYYSGKVKPKEDKPATAHSEAKANAYQPQPNASAGALIGEEIPFDWRYWVN